MIIEHIIKSLTEMKDAAIGSLVYFLYGHFIKKTDLWKGVISFMIGTTTALYVSPAVLSVFPLFHISSISFICGLLGMKMAEVIIDLDLKTVIKEKVDKLIIKK